MSRYTKLFEELEKKNEGAFVPFMNIGDPSVEASERILSALVEGGADALELGIPFSDPGADGPVIQRSDKRALDAGANTVNCFEVIKKIRNKYPDLPIGLLMYINLVYAPGIENFFKMCEDASVDSVLIPDVPLPMMEIETFWHELAEKHNVDIVMLAPPNTDDESLARIAKLCKGYIYLVSRKGITGVEKPGDKPTKHIIQHLKDNGAPPALLGFGISKPEQVKEAIEEGAAGAITGSAIVKIVEEHLNDLDTMCSEITKFAKAMKAATIK